MDTADPTLAGNHANVNLGLKKRYEFSKESGIIEMAGPIFFDVFVSERLLLRYADLKIPMNRNVDEFCLKASEADADYRVKLTDVYLKIRKVKVNPSISIALGLALKKGPAIYPMRHVECKSFIIPAGNPSWRKDNLYNGLVPKTIIFGMVDRAAFNGAYKKNPFNFQNSTTSFLAISVNGEEVPFKPLQLSYTAATRRYIEAFLTLFSGTGKLFYDVGNDISRDEFVNGLTSIVLTSVLTYAGPPTILTWSNAEIFSGVFPCDKLPQMIDKYSCGFVANTDPSSEPGTHWISIGIGLSNGRGDHNKILGEYFDSYTGLIYHWCLETIWKTH